MTLLQKSFMWLRTLFTAGITFFPSTTIGTLLLFLKATWRTARILGEVDLLTCKHCVPCIFNSPLLGKIHQHLKHIFVDLVLAVINQEWPVLWSLQLDGELVKPP